MWLMLALCGVLGVSGRVWPRLPDLVLGVTAEQHLVGNITAMVRRERAYFDTLVVVSDYALPSSVYDSEWEAWPVIYIDGVTRIAHINQVYNLNRNFAAPPEQPYMVVITLTDSRRSTVLDSLQSLMKVYFWRARLKLVLVIVAPIDDEKRHKIDFMFEYLWSKLVLNCAIMFFSPAAALAGGGVEMFTQNPFTGVVTNCGRGECFPDKLEQLHGARVTVSMADNLPETWAEGADGTVDRYVGRDGSMMNALMEKLNASVRYMAPRDGEIFGRVMRPDVVTGTIGDVFFERADFAFNRRFMLQDQLYYVEATYPSDRDDLTILVPRAKQLPDFQNYFRIFSIETLHAMLLCVATVVVVAGILAAHERPFLEHAIYFGNFFSDLVRLTFMLQIQSTYLLASLRICLISYGIFSYVMCNAFSSNLIGVLTVRPHLSEINTLDELATSGVIVKTFPRYITMLEKQLRKRDIRVLRQFMPISEKELLTDVFYKHHFGYMMKRSAAELFLNHPLNFIGNERLYHIMRDKPIPELVSYIGRFGHPYMDRLNVIILRFHQSGLMEYWDRKHVNMVARMAQRWIPAPPPGGNPEETLMRHRAKLAARRDQPLNVGGFLMPLAMYGLGIAGALLVFLAELYNFYLKASVTARTRRYLQRKLVTQ